VIYTVESLGEIQVDDVSLDVFVKVLSQGVEHLNQLSCTRPVMK